MIILIIILSKIKLTLTGNPVRKDITNTFAGKK